MSGTVGLIDGDIIVFQVSAAVEKEIDWGNDEWSLHSDMFEARETIESRIRELKEEIKLDEIIFAFSDRYANFRKNIYPPYKSNRKAKRKPIVYWPLREHVYATYPCFDRPGLEGDDVLGILATARNIPTVSKFDKRIIVSIDKDLKTIPGLLYNTGKSELGVQETTEEDADYFHLVQTVTGDQVDGYPGLPGAGPVAAERELSMFKGSTAGLWIKVLALYQKKGYTEEDALTQARCARILRSSDYDFKKKEPILWNPPQIKL